MNEEYVAGEVMGLKAAMIALVKEIRAADPARAQALLKAAEAEAVEMTSEDIPTMKFGSLRRGALSTLREVLFLDDGHASSS